MPWIQHLKPEDQLLWIFRLKTHSQGDFKCSPNRSGKHSTPNLIYFNFETLILFPNLSQVGYLSHEFTLKWHITTYYSNKNFEVLSNLCTTTQNLWPLLRGGRCLEVAFWYKNWRWNPKMLANVDKWSLTQNWLYAQSFSLYPNEHNHSVLKNRFFLSNHFVFSLSSDSNIHRSVSVSQQPVMGASAIGRRGQFPYAYIRSKLAVLPEEQAGQVTILFTKTFPK